MLKKFAEYTTLNIFGMLGLSCYILVDTFFISKGLGANGLAALNLAIPVYSFVHGCGLMLSIGGATRYSVLHSQNKQTDANGLFTRTLFLGGIFGLGFAAVGAFFSQSLTTALGADHTVFQHTNTYIKIILLFAPAFILNEIFVSFVRNDGDPTLAMLGMLGGSISNILLDYLFIFPLNMGIFGAVLATGFAPIISMAILSPHLLKKRNSFHIAKSKAPVKAIFALGFPSLVTEVSSGIVMIVFNGIILSLRGNIGVAAYGVIANLALVVVAIYTGIAQGIQPLISSAHGSKDMQSIKEVLRYAIITMLFISALIYSLVFFLASPITQIFNSENSLQLQQIATAGLKRYFLAVPFAGLNIILCAYFTSTERPLPAHIISLLRGFAVIIPLSFLLSALWGLTGVWLTFPATEMLVAIFGIMLFKNGQTGSH